MTARIGTTKRFRERLSGDGWVFLLLLAITCLLYANSLNAPFYLDDIPEIKNRPSTYDLSLAARHLLRQRGIAHFSFALNYRFFKLSLPAFHAVNIALHVLAGFLVFLVLKRVFPGQRLLCMFGALVFLCHPLQTQPVNYLVQRTTLLSGSFLFLSVYLFVRAKEALRGSRFLCGRHLVLYGSFIAAGAMAVMTKQNAATLPFLLLVFEFAPLNADAARSVASRMVYIAPSLVVPAVLAVTLVLGPVLSGSTSLSRLGRPERLRVEDAMVEAQAAKQDAGAEREDVRVDRAPMPLRYLVTEFSIFWIYVKLLVVPIPQVLDYGYPLVDRLLTLRNILAGAGILALCVLAVLVRKRAPRVFLAVFWFGIALAVESSVIPLDPVFEHRLYVPMSAFVVLVCAALAAGDKSRYRVPAWVLAGLALVTLAGLTVRRNAVWADPLELYAADARHTVGSYRPGMMLADTYYSRGQYELAQQEYDKVFSRFDESNLDRIPPKVLINMAIVYGRFHNVARAETLLRAAKRTAPRMSEVRYNLGIALFLQERYAEALEEFALARKYAPGNVKVLYYYILLSATHGDRDEALRLLDDMRRVDPGYARQIEERLGVKPKN